MEVMNKNKVKCYMKRKLLKNLKFSNLHTNIKENLMNRKRNLVAKYAARFAISKPILSKKQRAKSRKVKHKRKDG